MRKIRSLPKSYDGIKGHNARKKTSNKWFETQDTIAYWDDFSRQKILWGEISDIPKFSIDLKGEYCPEATVFMMTGEHLEYLLCYLNSAYSEYFFAKYGTTTGMGTLRWKKYLVELLPIPEVSHDDETKMKQQIKRVLEGDGNECLKGAETIDTIVFNRLGLSSEERLFILDMNKLGSH